MIRCQNQFTHVHEISKLDYGGSEISRFSMTIQTIYSFNSVKSMGSSESRSDSPIGIASNSPPPAANHPLHHGQDYPYHQHSVRKLS